MKRLFDDKKYISGGLTAFFVIVASISFFMLLQHWPGIKAAIEKIISVLSPFIWGFVIAYLLHPVVSFFENKLFDPLFTKLCKKHPDRVRGCSRAVSVVLSILLLIVLLTALLWMMLPQLYSSIKTIVDNIPDYVNTITGWTENLFREDSEYEAIATSYLNTISDQLTNWFKNTILPELSSVITNITTGIYVVVKSLVNVLIGFIISLYLMFSREKYRGGIKKILYSIFNTKQANFILRGIRFTDNAFMGFISGKLIDSLIIGIICYIGCSILRMPYSLLVSVIVGVTNIIPFFGPFIGAVPSALIILMISPVKCLIFIIFIIVLQQIDGNILGPKILSRRSGLNGFWVMFAIIVGGGLFGFIGMLLGVPIFTVIIEGIRYLINSLLKRRSLPTGTDEYEYLHHIDSDSGEFVLHPPEDFWQKKSASEDSPEDANS